MFYGWVNAVVEVFKAVFEEQQKTEDGESFVVAPARNVDQEWLDGTGKYQGADGGVEEETGGAADIFERVEPYLY